MSSKDKTASTHLETGLRLLKAGDCEGAVIQFRSHLLKSPDNPAALEGLGKACYGSGDLIASEQAFRQLAGISPGADSNGMLGVVLLELGQAAEAEAALSRAVACAPGNAVWLMNHGNALRELGRIAEAEERFRASLTANPSLAEAWLNLGDLLHRQGLWRKADEAWAKAEAIRPDWTMVRWKRIFAPLPTLAESEAEIEACRSEFARRLKTFGDNLPHDFSLETVGLAHPFLLAYQGRDDGPLMKLYGGLVEAAAQRSLPQYRKPLVRRLLHSGERLRVGFASAFFCSHSVWKIPLSGWINNLDRSQFEVFCYHLGSRWDEITDQAAAMADHFENSPKTVYQWADRIAGDRLHALIYPEIGMDDLTIQLAALRFAPVQAVGLGHPQTTGLGTIDFMLSSAFMQPESSGETYTEGLVPLPGIGVSYAPEIHPPHVASRRELAVEEDAILFWCCHYISKYEPRHDTLYPLIAKGLPKARFLFLGPVLGTTGSDILRRRLHAAFAAQGMEADDYVRLLPRMNIEQFDAVGRACDLFLDNPGWSGFNSALECLAVGLPVLTCRGNTVRSNHAAAVLERIGLGDVIANDMEELATMAVLLGKYPDARAALSTRIAEGLPQLYEDPSPVRALEDWLFTVSKA